MPLYSIHLTSFVIEEGRPIGSILSQHNSTPADFIFFVLYPAVLDFLLLRIEIFKERTFHVQVAQHLIIGIRVEWNVGSSTRNFSVVLFLVC